MKRPYFSILLLIFLVLHLSTLDIFAQSCTQLSLPENAFTRLCRQEGGEADSLDFSPDGKTLASVIGRQVILWDIEKKTEKLTINNTNGKYVRYSPDGKTLVCGDKLYDTATGEPTLLLLDGDGYKTYVVFSPDGKILAGAGPKGIRFWSSYVDEPTTNALPVGDLPIDVLPTGTSTINTPEETRPTSTPFATSSTTVPGIRGLSYAPDGKELAIVCSLGIWIYDVELNSEKTLLTEEMGGHHGVYNLTYAPDGSILASVGYDNTIRIWDAKTKELKSILSDPKISNNSLWSLYSVAFSPESEIIITANTLVNHSIHFWDTTTGEYKWTLPGPVGEKTITFSPDGNAIASASNDGSILLWDITSYPIVGISPDTVPSLTVGNHLLFDVKITNGKNLSGYQATIEFDPESLEYVETKYGTFLSGGVPVQPIANQRSGTVKLASLSLSGDESSGDGSLATIKFKVNANKVSKIGLRDVILSDSEGNKSYAWINGAEILKSAVTEEGESITCSPLINEDVNRDCVVNIQDLVLVATNFGKGGGIASDVNSDGRVDIIDLVLVAGAFEYTAGAPAVYEDAHEMLSASNVQQWLREARAVNPAYPTFQRGILMLEQLLITALPKKRYFYPTTPTRSTQKHGYRTSWQPLQMLAFQSMLQMASWFGR